MIHAGSTSSQVVQLASQNQSPALLSGSAPAKTESALQEWLQISSVSEI